MTKALFSKLMAAILACAVFTLVLFSCSMTILGDKYQTLDEEMRDVTAFQHFC